MLFQYLSGFEPILYTTHTNEEPDIWKLNGENFEIVTKMRELKDSIEEIKTQCK